MKIYTFILATLFFVGIGKLTAQTNDEEARVIYQMAQEEYDKGNVHEASVLLNELLKMEPKAKKTVAYLQAKCFETDLFKDETPDQYYIGCMAWITTYLETGMDENKKNELIALKIKIEHTDQYKLAKDFENVSRNDALKMLDDARKQYPTKYKNIMESPLRLNDKYLNIFNARLSTDYENWVNFDVLRLELNNGINIRNGEYEFVNSRIEEYTVTYHKEKLFRNYVEEDISSFLAYNLKAHSSHICNCFTPRNYITGYRDVMTILGHIYNTSDAGSDFNIRMIYALKAMFNNK